MFSLREEHDQNLELSSLPDEILVRIGLSVAQHCGIQDFVSLSMVSKRWKRLLIDSEVTISDVIRIRTRTTSWMDGQSSLHFSSSSSFSAGDICTLEQLRFYEMVRKHKLFEENRVHFDFADLKVADSDSIDLIRNVRKLLKTHKSASVVLEAHCGTPAPTDISWLYSHYRGRVVSAAIVRGTESLALLEDSTRTIDEDHDTRPHQKHDSEKFLSMDRVRMRAWGKMITELVSRSKRPYGELARQGRGWVEIFLRMEDPDTGDVVLEFPPRPGFYSQVSYTPQDYRMDRRQMNVA